MGRWAERSGQEEEAGRSGSTARLKKVQKEEPSDSSLPTKQALLNISGSPGYKRRTVRMRSGGALPAVGIVAAHLVAGARVVNRCSELALVLQLSLPFR